MSLDKSLLLDREVTMDKADRSRRIQNDYLRTAEVARLLHVSPKTISRWAKEEKLPFVRTLGGHRRFPAERIRELAMQMSEGL